MTKTATSSMLDRFGSNCGSECRSTLVPRSHGRRGRRCAPSATMFRLNVTDQAIYKASSMTSSHILFQSPQRPSPPPTPWLPSTKPRLRTTLPLTLRSLSVSPTHRATAERLRLGGELRSSSGSHYRDGQLSPPGTICRRTRVATVPRRYESRYPMERVYRQRPIYRGLLQVSRCVL